MLPLLRRAASVALAVVLAVLTLAAVAVVGVAAVGRDGLHPATAGGHQPAPPASSSPAGRFTVAVVVGANGTVGSDVLAPYEVFARSADFSVFTVAASAAPVPLEGGPALVPAHTFAEVDAGLVPRPDVVVVPALTDPTGAAEAPLRDWVVSQSRSGADVLSVCNGAQVLAVTGLLDGHRATSHWSTLSALQRTRPAVHWVRGQRYVRDGSITTTAGVTSGVPGALAVIDELAGPAEAARVGREVQYPGWSLDGPTAIPGQHFALADLPVGLDHVLPWGRPVVGVGLADGGGEIDLAAAFEVYSMSAAARTIPLAVGPTVTTRHGVVLVTTPVASAPAVDRLIVPGATGLTAVDPGLRNWAAERGVAVDPLHGAAGELGFDAALQDLAAHGGRGVALSAAKMIDYPAVRLPVSISGGSWRAPLLSGLALLLAVGVGLLPTALRRTARHRRAGRRPSGSSPSRAIGPLAVTASAAAADPS